MSLTLSILDGLYAVCRLPPDHPLPDWAAAQPFVSLTRTDEELSVVCLQNRVPSHLPAERGFRLLKVHGPLDFSLVGVLASLSQPLAAARISLLALSTHDTDYLLVRDQDLGAAVGALTEAGHHLPGSY